MLRRPPTRIELKTEDKEEFEALRREYLRARELGSADADSLRRAAKERERARRLGLDRVGGAEETDA